MKRFALALILLTLGTAAQAHKLGVFATAEGDTISGYGFFVGGGNPANVPWTATSNGNEIATGETDDEGRFSFNRTTDAAIEVTIDTEEGHISSATIEAATAETDINAQIERAIQPLREDILRLENRLRFMDILSAVFLIIGLTGMALWARGRNK
ncbi:cobalamin biosynthesis protein CbiL [Marivivens aquimaris]|uniref:cobalamin biosynthesis protein CbiL n=1 Tax=Marivivens aquimaris TaxID=2774876 RepID=UPI0018825BC4|nr:cobalamin biosynthesis protein CbiL [Marivivens aquimaris]